jgi:poly(A) polymerase Pap1
MQLNWPTQQQQVQEQQEDAMASLISFVAEKAAEGKKRNEVVDELTRMGVPYPVAAEVSSGVFGHVSKLKRKAGGKQIGYGLLMLVVGGTVTGISYAVAEPGGVFFATIGLFIAGVITFIIGLFRWLTN